MTGMEELLAKIGWSKAHFAERVGVRVRTVYGWCRRETAAGRIAMKYLELVSRVLNA